MVERIPEEAELRAMLGESAVAAWDGVREFLDAHYVLDPQWDKGGKAAVYQCRYRRGGKTTVTLLFKPGELGCMMVFGAAEREKVEQLRGSLSPEALAAYVGAPTYHDGKWVWFSMRDSALLPDVITLLPVKRRLMK